MKKYFLLLVFVLFFWASIPWTSVGLPLLDKKLSDFKLGLDLHGGVELDYLVDFSSIADITDERKAQILEDMKTILDSRVRRVGTTEPTLNTAQYGEETHIIVQIPTPNSHSKLEPVEKTRKDAAFITEAKSVIGQVVKIQFKEIRSNEEFETEKNKRPAQIAAISKSFGENKLPFDAWSQRIADSYENVFSYKDGDIMQIVGSSELKVSDLEKLFPVATMALKEKTFTGKIDTINFTENTGIERKGIGFITLESLDSKPLTPESPVSVKLLFIDNDPLSFKPAYGNNNQILDEKHLINTFASLDPVTSSYSVSLQFDTEGGAMFGDITERNAGREIAIFLGNTLLTAPRVSSRIDGNAIITSGSTVDGKAWATALSKKINEGIVPVGIYEHSEKTIGPNLGKRSMNELIFSGLLGLLAICIFLIYRYGTAGIIAGVSLIVYLIILIGLIRVVGLTLTLSGIAGIVLSIGIAIDSNILILERVKDFQKIGMDEVKSIKHGLAEAWSAIWDSNLTGLIVGLLLWWLGVSMMKGFGQMTVLGIVVSLFVIQYFANPLTLWWKQKFSSKE